MSIHEVIYDTEGRIVQARCIDEKITLAKGGTIEIEVDIDGYPYYPDF